MVDTPSPAPDRDGPVADEHSSESGQAVFDEVSGGLRAFLRSRLRQESDVDDCLQAVTVKMLLSIGDVAPAARRAWLFRVAANEAARMWRTEASRDRMLENRHQIDEGKDHSADQRDPADAVILNEMSQQLQRALLTLPPEWRQIVQLRIQQNLTFREIADQLDVPLGTALTRMRRALERLRAEIDPDKS